MDDRKVYTGKVAERILGLLAMEQVYEVRRDGIYLTEDFARACVVPVLLWAPQCALIDVDPQESPLLPIPFSAKDLAAFFLCPVARGGYRSELRAFLTKVRDGMALQAFDRAAAELDRAEIKVGQFDFALATDAEHTTKIYGQWRAACTALITSGGRGLSREQHLEQVTELMEKVCAFEEASRLARQRADAYDIEWLNQMVRVIYDRENSNQSILPEDKLHDEAPTIENVSAFQQQPVTRKALIQLHRDRWPSIKSDLSHAAKNGLSTRAKAEGRCWHEEEAVTWARERKKYNPIAASTGVFAWNRN